MKFKFLVRKLIFYVVNSLISESAGEVNLCAAAGQS